MQHPSSEEEMKDNGGLGDIEIDEQDVKFFTAAALSGLLANPLLSTPEQCRYRLQKGLSIEAMALNSAIHTIRLIGTLRNQLSKNAKTIDDAVNKMAANGDAANGAV